MDENENDESGPTKFSSPTAESSPNASEAEARIGQRLKQLSTSKLMVKSKISKAGIAAVKAALTKGKMTSNVAWEVLDHDVLDRKKLSRRKGSISKEFKQSAGKTSLSINRTKKIDSRLQPLIVDYPDLKVVKVIRNPKDEHVSTTQLPSLEMKSAIKDRTTLISLATNPSISRRSQAPSTKTNVDWEGRKIPKPISRFQCASLILLFVGMLVTLTLIFLYLTQSFSSDNELLDATPAPRAVARKGVTGSYNNEEEDDVDEEDDGNGEKTVTTDESSRISTKTIKTTIPTTTRRIVRTRKT